MTTEFKKTTGTNKNNIENQEQRTREHRTQEQITKDKHKINEHSQEQRKQNKFNQHNQRTHIKKAPQQRTRTHDKHQNVGQRTRANTMSKTNDNEQKRL